MASIESDTPAPSVYYNHLDHLGSTQVVSGEDGYLAQVLGYYPFGDARIEQTYGGTSQNIQYVGTRHDTETDLNLMGARYTDTKRGQFISQDRANIDLGSHSWESQYGRPLELFLSDPQQLNTYSYARNNPIVNKDPGGDIIPLGLGLYYAGIALMTLDFAGTVYDVYNAVSTEFSQDVTKQQKQNAWNLVALGTVVPGSGKFADDIFGAGKISMNRAAWSPGSMNNPKGSLANHYKDHGSLVGAKSVQDYYNKANDAMKPGSGFTRLQNADGKVDYYNPSNRELVGLNGKGQISTYHKVTNENKAAGLDYRVKKKQNGR